MKSFKIPTFLYFFKTSIARAGGVKSWIPFVHISKLKGDITFSILENAQAQNGEAVFSC